MFFQPEMLMKNKTIKQLEMTIVMDVLHLKVVSDKTNSTYHCRGILFNDTEIIIEIYSSRITLIDP